MNLAVILVDVEQDLGVVVVTNFPEGKAVAAADAVLERLYREFGGKEGALRSRGCHRLSVRNLNDRLAALDRSDNRRERHCESCDQIPFCGVANAHPVGLSARRVTKSSSLVTSTASHPSA